VGLRSERNPDGFKHAIELAVHFKITEPKHSVAKIVQGPVADVVATAVIVEAVLMSINLDNEPRLSAFKVDHIVCDWRLAAKVVAD
jgi:hypothetical protein